MTSNKHTETIIRERAYQIWEASGRPDGVAEEHWFKAMQELFAKSTLAAPVPSKKTKGEPASKKAPSRRRPAKKPS